MRLSWKLMFLIIWVSGVSSLATYLAHTRIKRTGSLKNCRSFGTVYLNEILGLKPTGGLDVSYFELEPNDPLMVFFKRAATKAKPYMTNPAHDYDVWMVGFYGAWGWPFVSSARSTFLAIEETKVRPDPSLGPSPYHFGPSTSDQFVQHQLWIDEFASSPIRPMSMIANWVVYAGTSLGLWEIGMWLIRRIKAARASKHHGFPVVVNESEQPRDLLGG